MEFKMQEILRRSFRGLAMMMVCAAWAVSHQVSAAAGERAANMAPPEACALLTNTDVQKVTGRKMFTEPTPMSLKGGAGALCGFDNAQVILFSGDNSETLWDGFLKGFGYGDVQKYPVSGLGDKAYAFYFKPQNEHQDAGTFIVVSAGKRTVAVSVSAEEGQPSESVQPQAVELAKMVLAKLP
jgi:hypothetical protein